LHLGSLGDVLLFQMDQSTLQTMTGTAYLCKCWQAIILEFNNLLKTEKFNADNCSCHSILSIY